MLESSATMVGDWQSSEILGALALPSANEDIGRQISRLTSGHSHFGMAVEVNRRYRRLASLPTGSGRSPNGHLLQHPYIFMKTSQFDIRRSSFNKWGSSTALIMTDKKPIRILSGIQPSGVLHIGNYFGMIQPAIALQEKGEAFYFVANYHALTSVREAGALRGNSRRVALDFLACGFDPDRGALFMQTAVPEVTELAWILSTVAPMGLLERAHSYKDKLARGMPASAGLFTYPVLMAADILIYDTDIVPVGKDQKQHIEITRDLAVKINEQYGSATKPVFKLPEPSIRAETETVPGMDGQKMSKSYGNTIDIFGEEKEMRKRVMSIVTDSSPMEAPKDPESSTIFQLYSLFASEAEREEMRQSFVKGGTGYGDFKKQLFEKLWEYFRPMRKRREELLADPSYIDGVLARGAERANGIAHQVMKRVRDAVGLE